MKKNILTSIIITTLITLMLTTPVFSTEADKENPEQSSVTPSDSEDYIINPGDVLEIVTWKEPDFTKEVIVRNDGKFSFPLLDDVRAENLTTMQVKQIIEKD